MSQALAGEGYEVISVENGKKAIEAAKAHHFDFVITDLFMPESNGWDVLEMTRQTESPPRVIVMTAHGKEETGRMAKERGAWAYVEKPYIIDRIKDLLKEVSREKPGHRLR